ncbi:asparagine synthase-related protein [Streptomyces sp. NPDC059708]|uniref:asparagine synthase-related protein n=1 Tax=Streptomyces sp. NPDC059708 TaxID=3346916 RepID=UPI0036CE3F7E
MNTTGQSQGIGVGTMRFVAGTFHAGHDSTRAGALWRPRGGHSAYDDTTSQVWTTGYGADEVRASSAPDGTAALLAIGCCLATEGEFGAATTAAARGQWAPATRLAGAYLSVVRTGSMVRIAGDRAGTVTVYWLHEEDRAWWATAAAPLAAYAGAQVDPAVLLAAFTLRGVDVLAGDSHFHTVRRVPPGHTLVLETGQQPRTEPVPHEVPGVSFAEGAPLVRDAITTAVARRVEAGRPLSSDLSGGVDSGTITTLAAARTPLLALTYTDERMGAQDDVLFAERIAADRTSITHAWVHGTREGVQHFDGLEEPAALPFTDTPSFTLGLLAIKAAQLAPAASYGSAAHLTGRGGDDVLDAVPAMLIDQYRAGHRLAAIGGALSLARARRYAVHPLLRQAARTQATGYPQALAVLAEALNGPEPLRHPGWTPAAEMLSWCGTTAPAPWLTRAGRAAVADLVAARAEAADPDAAPGRLHERLALELMGDGHATYDTIARRLWGLPVHAPLLDTPIVDICHAIPGWQRHRPGDFKPLARAAFTGSVPAFLLNRRTKTAFTGSLYAGLRANASTLRRILTGSVLGQAGLLDAGKARAALDGAVRGEPAPLAGLHALIVTELWLATLPTARQTWWEKSTVKETAR